MKSDALRAIFIHIPKCGGTSIETILFQYASRTPDNFWMGGINKTQKKYTNPISRLVSRHTTPIVNKYQTGGLQHLSALQIRHAMGRNKFENYYRFAVVRHPVQRSLSQYRYMQKRPDLMRWIGMETQDSFRVYLQKTYERAHVQWQPQISFVNDYLGNQLVNDVIKLEELGEQMPKVFDKLSIPQQDIPHLNKTATTYQKDNLKDDEKEIIWELYKEDFEEFGYDPENNTNV